MATKTADPTVVRHFKHDDFQFGFEIALGSTYRGAADAGEVLATASRIKDGDADAWVSEWTATADNILEAADATTSDVTRLAHLRRAATYYATATYLLDHSSEADSAAERWRTQRDVWERIVDATHGERIQIPYEDTPMPGYFFRAPDAGPDGKRPLVVLNNGSDGATSQMWLQGGAAAAERGYHWMTFDGPGQNALLFEHDVPFRPDWEAVLTPVVDAMVARADVDPDRIAVIGVSQGGFWIPRALSFEHRFAAGVADPGVVDVSASWTATLPNSMRKELDDGNQKSFDRNMHLAERFSADTRATLTFRGRPYGLDTDSRYELYKEVLRYRLGDELEQLRTPLLITEPEGEQFWPGQSQELYDRLTGPKELARFAAADGGARHCEPLGLAQRDARVYDWLEQYLKS